MKTGVSDIIPSAGRLYKLYDVTYSYLGGPSLFMFSNSRSVVWVKIGAVSWSRMCELRSSGNTFWWRERALFNWTLALFPLFFLLLYFIHLTPLKWNVVFLFFSFTPYIFFTKKNEKIILSRFCNSSWLHLHTYLFWYTRIYLFYLIIYFVICSLLHLLK